MSLSTVAQSSRRLLISRIAALVLGLAAAYYPLHSILIMWTPGGGFGIGIDPRTAVVKYLAPEDAAKGIRIGDRVDLAAMPFRERGYLYEQLYKPAGWRMTVPVIHGSQHRTAMFEVRDFSDPNNLALSVYAWLHKIVATIFVVTGVIVVWNRPSVMLWALALFLIRTHTYLVSPLRSPGVAAVIVFTYAFIFSLGLPALIVFTSRFPTGRMSNATKYWDVLAAASFVVSFYLHIHDFIPLFTARPIGDLPDAPITISTAIAYVLVFVALCVKMRKQNRGPLAALSWIVAGYGVGIVLGFVALNDLLDNVTFDTYWPSSLQQIVMLALPASVAYSIIRYRAFDLGFFAIRTLVHAALFIGIGSTLLVGVWSTTFMPSTLALGTSMFVALLVGMIFQAYHTRAVRFVDRFFLPHRYELGQSLDRIGERLHGAGDLRKLTDEVASTLGLASVAVFARTADGGFVRTAACGWPEGTTWHLLPDEALTRSLDAGTSIIAFPDATDAANEEPALPVSHARPEVALTLRRGDRVERAILVGACSNGSSLDRDVIRSLHGIFDGVLVA